MEFQQEQEFESRVIKIYRTATVKRGGRRFRFAALAVVGDGKSRVGIGYGKANEVPLAVQKAEARARKSMVTVPVLNGTIPHEIIGRECSSRILLKPAAPGTGVKACSAVRAVLEVAGYKNVITKSIGNNNAKNLAKATLNALLSLTTPEEIKRLRGVDPVWTSTR